MERLHNSHFCFLIFWKKEKVQKNLNYFKNKNGAGVWPVR
jgi:hypothetical protein